MKANFDFGYIKQDERENTSLFLSSFFKNQISLTGNIRKFSSGFNSREEKRFFKFNDVIFSISFPSGTSLDDEKFLFSCMKKWQEEGNDIKKISSYLSCFPIFEEEFILAGKRYFFSCPEKISLNKKDSKNNFNELLNLKIRLKTRLFCNEIKKINRDEFLIIANSFFIYQEAIDNKNFYGTININDKEIILKMEDLVANDLTTKDLESKNASGNNLTVKGEIYIGDIELDLKSLSLLAPNDKIILSKEENIKAVLKIADNKILSGHLDFSDDENLKFVVEEKM